MSRLIDADALKTKMLDYYSYSWQLREEIGDFFDNAPTIESQKWVPVSERLPKEKSDVLVTISDGFNPFVDTDLWDGDRFFCYGNHRVEAWQPLPDPWKGDNNAD